MDMGLNANDSDKTGGMQPGAIVGGAFLLVVGGTMFLDRAGFSDVSWPRVAGPACLIFLGMLMLVDKGAFACGRREKLPDGTFRMHTRRGGGLTGGLWLLGVGCWMLVSQLHAFGLDYHTSWPLLIILSGTIMLVRGVR
jgi:hypothetical protein